MADRNRRSESDTHFEASVARAAPHLGESKGELTVSARPALAPTAYAAGSTGLGTVIARSTRYGLLVSCVFFLESIALTGQVKPALASWRISVMFFVSAVAAGLLVPGDDSHRLQDPKIRLPVTLVCVGALILLVRGLPGRPPPGLLFTLVMLTLMGLILYLLAASSPNVGHFYSSGLLLLFGILVPITTSFINEGRTPSELELAVLVPLALVTGLSIDYCREVALRAGQVLAKFSFNMEAEEWASVERARGGNLFYKTKLADRPTAEPLVVRDHYMHGAILPLAGLTLSSLLLFPWLPLGWPHLGRSLGVLTVVVLPVIIRPLLGRGILVDIGVAPKHVVKNLFRARRRIARNLFLVLMASATLSSSDWGSRVGMVSSKLTGVVGLSGSVTIGLVVFLVLGGLGLLFHLVINYGIRTKDLRAARPKAVVFWHYGGAKYVAVLTLGVALSVEVVAMSRSGGEVLQLAAGAWAVAALVLVGAGLVGSLWTVDGQWRALEGRLGTLLEGWARGDLHEAKIIDRVDYAVHFDNVDLALREAQSGIRFLRHCLGALAHEKARDQSYLGLFRSLLVRLVEGQHTQSESRSRAAWAIAVACISGNLGQAGVFMRSLCVPQGPQPNARQVGWSVRRYGRPERTLAALIKALPLTLASAPVARLLCETSDAHWRNPEQRDRWNRPQGISELETDTRRLLLALERTSNAHWLDSAEVAGTIRSAIAEHQPTELVILAIEWAKEPHPVDWAREINEQLATTPQPPPHPEWIEECM